MRHFSLVLLLSMAAAVAFALSSAFKHVSAGQVADAQNLRPGRVAALIRGTLTHRWWLAGMACDAVGLTGQIGALHFGSLSVVQPLLLVSLPLALLFRAGFAGHELTGRQLIWAGVLVAALAGFLALATRAPAAAAERVDGAAAVAAGAAGAAVVLSCMVIARRARRTAVPVLLGTAVGVVYAGTAALLKACGALLATGGIEALVTEWPIYAVVGLGAGGLLLNQLTFQAGALSAGLATTATVDAIASFAVGITVYGEQIRPGATVIVLQVLLCGLLVLAAAQLTRPMAQAAAGSRRVS